MNKQDIQKIINWIKNYFNKNSFAKGVVIGMSGGKDSFVVAKLCVEALGKDNVLGIIMPNGEMPDKNDAIVSCDILGIKYVSINIGNIYKSVINNTKNVLSNFNKTITDVSIINTAPRIRMTMLYSIAGSLGYLVANTSNLSESMVGYTTKWGDNVGDFAPIANFTKSEVCEIGNILGLPDYLVNKTPSDGLSGKSDEDKMGLKYANLDEFIRTGIKKEDFTQIEKMHKFSFHKRIGVIKYVNDYPNYFNNEENE